MDSDLSQGAYTPQRSPKKSRRLLVIIFVVIIIGAFVFGGKRFLGSEDQKEDLDVDISPSIDIELPTDTPSPTETESLADEPTIAPTAKPTVNPIDKATGIDRSALSVEVQNGSGEFGAASKASEVLKTFGYHVAATGNADNFNYENVIIKVKNDKSNFLDLLKKDLGFSYTVGSSSADLDSSSTSDALVIIGK